MNTHKVKILPHFYDQLRFGERSFHITEHDKNYQKGDIVHLCPYDSIKQEFLPSVGIKRKITYIMTGWGVKDGYVALGLENSNNVR